MASEETFHRRIQPIYDAIDARNFKAAVKASDAALKKYKGHQLVRALKSYALVKSGKRAECLQLLAELVTEGPADDGVLRTMTFSYKTAGADPGAITAAYASACERRPSDPELLTGLFGCHVREGSYIKQQQVAAKLAKLAPQLPAKAAGGSSAPATEGGGDRYAWWVVCSLALQARTALLERGRAGEGEGGGTVSGADAGSDGLAGEKLLQLAGTMAARQVQRAGGRTSYESLLLYLDILQGQGKAATTLEVLDGAVGEASVPLPADRLQLRAAAAERAGDAAAAAAAYRQALLTNPDDWQSVQLYLDCLLPASAPHGGMAMTGPSGSRFPVGIVGGLADLRDRQQAAAHGSPAHPTPQQVTEAVAAAQATLAELAAQVEGSAALREQVAGGSLRAPVLAPLELLLRRLALAGDDSADERRGLLQNMAEAVLGAYRQLGHTFSCAPDLRPYLAALAASPPHAAWLASQLHAASAEGEAASATSSSSNLQAASSDAAPDGNGNGYGGSSSAGVKALQRQVNALLLESELGLPAFASSAQAEGYAARLLRLYQRHLHLSESLDEKDRGYGEELVGMAVGALLAAGRLEAGTLGRRMAQALLVLEAAQVRRHVSAPLRLACTALYGLLAAPQCAARQFAALDIKHILHDSMTGHWLLPALLGSAADGELPRWLSSIAALHDDHQSDAGDTLLLAYQHGAYSKVLEFVDFQERLQHSHTRLLGRAEAAAAQLRTAGGGGGGAVGLAEAAARAAAALEADPLVAALTSGQGAEQSKAAAALRFDEDLSTRPAWFPPHLGAARAGLASWWDGDATPPFPGYAACWWSEVAAAESRGEHAAAWRQGQLAALQRRLLLPALLAAALAKQPSPAQLDLLQRCSQEWAAESSPSGVLDRLASVLAAAAHGVQSVVAALLEKQMASVDVAAAVNQLLALQQQYQEACNASAVGLAADSQLRGLPLPASHTAMLVAPLLSEDAAWAASCLQAWSHSLRALASSSSKSGAEGQAAAGQVLAGVQAAAVALHSCVQAVAAALHALSEPAQPAQVKQAAAALDLFGSGGAAAVTGASATPGYQEQPLQPLWSFEPKFKPLEVVSHLVVEQRDTLQRLRRAAQTVLQVLASAR